MDTITGETLRDRNERRRKAREERVELRWPGDYPPFSELRASDLSGRARAFQSMVGAGMDISKAAGIAGLMDSDD